MVREPMLICGIIDEGQEFGETILYGYFLSFHFLCERHITPHERVMDEKLENPGLGNGPKFV
jgi:hypothetical protein